MNYTVLDSTACRSGDPPCRNQQTGNTGIFYLNEETKIDTESLLAVEHNILLIIVKNIY